VTQSWEHYSSVRKLAGPHTGLPDVHIVPAMISKKRPSPSVDGDDDDQRRRARKRRSPLPLFDSDSTPEGTESSSDESNGPAASQQSSLDIPLPEHIVKPQKLTIKLRGLRTTDLADSPLPSRASSPAPVPAPLLSPTQVAATSTLETTTIAPAS
jgi:OTU domain-containing protein 3